MKDFEDKATNLKSENQKLLKVFDTLTKERDLAVEDQAKSKQDKQLMQVSLASMNSQLQESKLK